MANKNLFNSTKNSVPVTNCVNNAGGTAYSFSDKHAIAQIVCTNTMNGTYYADAEANLKLIKDSVLKLRGNPTFVAKLAVYARSKSYMKDTPAFLCAVLASWGEHKLFRKIFPLVIDNVKMLRNFIQIGRSGEAGKKLNMSSGAIRRAINDWFNMKSDDFIFRGSIGNDPSMRDVLRMSRPKPNTPSKAALFAYLIGTPYDAKKKAFITKGKEDKVLYTNKFSALPKLVQDYENFKKTHEGKIPNVDFRMLDSILNKDELKDLWKDKADNGSWQFTRMNLNNFSKYGVFDDIKTLSKVAARLSNKEDISRANVYPYQLLMAYKATDNVPHVIREALQDAMEIAIDNVPEIVGGVHVCVDTSGSMKSPITGYRAGSTSAVSCIDVAALFGAAILRRNKDATVLPFDTRVHECRLNGRDSVMTNSTILARFGGGGTDCSCALRQLNHKNATGNTVIFISDNESWVSNRSMYNYRTGLMTEWKKYKNRNPKAKLILIDLTPRDNSQVSEQKDILQIGGWSDECFNVISNFIEGSNCSDYWVEQIEKTSLESLDKTDSGTIMEMST